MKLIYYMLQQILKAHNITDVFVKICSMNYILNVLYFNCYTFIFCLFYFLFRIISYGIIFYFNELNL